MAAIDHINPAGVPRNPAFSQAVAARGSQATIYVGGQNGVTADGAVLEGMRAQAEQALRNLETVLEGAGVGLGQVAKWTVLAVRGAPLQEAVAAFAAVWGERGDPPAITLAVVEGLASPAFLIEIDAIAVGG
jgi:enamine deaminase RidA (YjgF/YER057c/UK114 family)